MDYLDPKKKKNKKIRLMIGYVLIGIAISMATVILVYVSRGYYVDSETGAVIQNGLIYVDTKPESASVFLNGTQQGGQTDARLVVPEGTYDIELQRDGYHVWSRTLRLEGGSLRRITYPRLIPLQLDSGIVLNLPATPSVASQSNDKRWLVFAYNDNPRNLQYIDMNAANPGLLPLALPIDLIEVVEGGEWEIIEWADDHKTFLARYGTAAAPQFFLIDRDDPTKSVDIATALPTETFTDVVMRDRKRDLLFLYDGALQTISTANVSNKQVDPFLDDVIEFVTFGRDRVLYISDPAADDGLVTAMFQRGNDEYVIKDELREAESYLLEMAQLGNAMVMGIGSPAENRVIVYNDPVNAIQQNDFSDLPIPTTVLRIENPQELTISADSSIILARSGTKFAAHEFEEDRSYTYSIEAANNESQELVWADGQHFIVASTNKDQMIVDFDGSNQHVLGTSEQRLGSFFDAPLDDLFTFIAGKESDPPRLMRTFMRTEADR